MQRSTIQLATVVAFVICAVCFVHLSQRRVLVDSLRHFSKNSLLPQTNWQHCNSTRDNAIHFIFNFFLFSVHRSSIKKTIFRALIQRIRKWARKKRCMQILSLFICASIGNWMVKQIVIAMSIKNEWTKKNCKWIKLIIIGATACATLCYCLGAQIDRVHCCLYGSFHLFRSPSDTVYWIDCASGFVGPFGYVRCQSRCYVELCQCRSHYHRYNIDKIDHRRKRIEMIN